MQSSTSVKSIHSFLFERNYRFIAVISLSVLLIFTAVSIWLSLSQNQGLAIIGIILGICFLYVCVQYPKFWIYSIATTSLIYFQPGGNDVSVLEVLHGGFFSASAVFWIFWMIFIRKEKIVRNIADWSILFFFVFLIFTFPLAIFNGNTIINWAREYVIFTVILLYFPIRHYFNDKKDIIILLVIFMFSMAISDVHQLIVYKRNAIQDAIYAFQLGASVRFKQSIFSMSIIFGFLFSLYSRKIWKRWAIILFTSLSSMALIVTFSRTFWIMVLLSLFISFFFVSGKLKIRYILTIIIIVTSFIGTILFVFRDNTQFIMNIIETRLSSTGKGTKDLSIQMRLMEYESVWKSIGEFPLGGRGLGTIHEYLQPMDLITIRTLNIHNGYLFFIFRIGYPLFGIFLFFIFYYLFKAGVLIFKTKNLFNKLLLLGSFNTLLLMLVVNFLTIVFNSKDGTFAILLSVAFISICEKALIVQKNEIALNLKKNKL